MGFRSSRQYITLFEDSNYTEMAYGHERDEHERNTMMTMRLYLYVDGMLLLGSIVPFNIDHYFRV